MSNPYFGENSQQNSAGGSGKAAPKGRKPSGALSMKSGPFPGLPGKATALRDPKGARRVQQHTKSEGV